MKHSSTPSFSTSDLGMAACLSMFVPLITIDDIDQKRVVFIFDDSTRVRALVEDYWAGRLTVEPRLYFEKIRGMKARIYARAS